MKMDKQFEEFVTQVMDTWHSPGLCLMVIHEDELIYANGFGFSDIQSNTTVNPETVFVAASTTKAFTSTALGILADEKKFCWNTPIKEYLPSFRLKDAHVERDITALDLLSHRTGYPRHDKVWFGTEKNRQEVVQSIQHLEPNRRFRDVFQYNNLMYVLAGRLVEEIAGTTWESFISERILEPLEMTRSNFYVSEMQTLNNAARGYMWSNDQYLQVSYRRAEQIGPAGSLNTCGKDMVQWLRIQLSQGRVGNRQIVSEETITKIHAPVMVAPSFLPGKYSEIRHTEYGLGWFNEVYRGERIVYHVGNLDGFYALISFMPEHRFGHVILTNMTPNRAPYVLSYSLYDKFLGLAQSDWNRRILDSVQQLEASERAMKEKKMNERILGTDPSFAYSAYEGTFKHPAYGEVRVFLKNDQLHIAYGEFLAQLVHYHHDVFTCSGSEKGFPGVTLATFRINSTRQIEGVAVPFEPAPGAKEIYFQKIE